MKRKIKNLYTIIEKDKDGYFAYIPELKGCVSQGDSYKEAYKNIIEACKLYLESKIGELAYEKYLKSGKQCINADELFKEVEF